MANNQADEELWDVWVSPIAHARALLADSQHLQWKNEDDALARLRSYLGVGTGKPNSTQVLDVRVRVTWVCSDGKLAAGKPLEFPQAELTLVGSAEGTCVLELPMKCSNLLRKPQLPAGVTLLGKTMDDDAYVCVSIKVPARPADGRPCLWLEIDGELCQQCNMHSRVEDNVICDVCNLASHLSCVGLSAVPTKDWTCKACKAAAKVPPPRAAAIAAAKAKSGQKQDAPAAPASGAMLEAAPAAAAPALRQLWEPRTLPGVGTRRAASARPTSAAVRPQQRLDVNGAAPALKPAPGSGLADAAEAKAGPSRLAPVNPAGQPPAPADQGRPKRSRSDAGLLSQAEPPARLAKAFSLNGAPTPATHASSGEGAVPVAPPLPDASDPLAAAGVAKPPVAGSTRGAVAAAAAAAAAAAGRAHAAAAGGSSDEGVVVRLPSGIVATEDGPFYPHLSTNITKLFEIEFSNKPRLFKLAKFVLAQPSRAVFARCSAQEASPDAPVYMLTAVMLRSPPGTPALWVSPAPGTGNPDVDRQVDSISRISQMRSAESQPRVTGSINWRTCVKFATVPLGATTYTPDLQLTWLLERSIDEDQLDTLQLDERYRAMGGSGNALFPASAVLPPAPPAGQQGASAGPAARPSALGKRASSGGGTQAKPTVPAPPPPAPQAAQAPAAAKAPEPPVRPQRATRSAALLPEPMLPTAGSAPAAGPRARQGGPATPASGSPEPPAAAAKGQQAAGSGQQQQQRNAAIKRSDADSAGGAAPAAAAAEAQPASKRLRRSAAPGPHGGSAFPKTDAGVVPDALPYRRDNLDVLAAAACGLEREQEEQKRCSGYSGPQPSSEQQQQPPAEGAGTIAGGHAGAGAGGSGGTIAAGGTGSSALAGAHGVLASHQQHVQRNSVVAVKPAQAQAVDDALARAAQQLHLVQQPQQQPLLPQLPSDAAVAGGAGPLPDLRAMLAAASAAAAAWEAQIASGAAAAGEATALHAKLRRVEEQLLEATQRLEDQAAVLLAEQQRAAAAEVTTQQAAERARIAEERAAAAEVRAQEAEQRASLLEQQKRGVEEQLGAEQQRFREFKAAAERLFSGV